jgi:cell division control protein 45
LDAIAPEYGMVELSYPSFVKHYGFRSRPLGAADATEAIAALLDVAGGIRMEVETEGTRGGGEWFGGARVWTPTDRERWHDEIGSSVTGGAASSGTRDELGQSADGDRSEIQWWVRNFWSAFDALDE